MADQFIGKVLADKYRIDSIIREDSLGKFYRGTQLLMEKPVAIKILAPALALDDEIVKQFSAEVRTLARLSHPNIPSVTDYGQEKNGTVFIVTEQSDGETLKNAVRREGQFSLEHANRITQQIASALSAAHANGVTHENLTDENIYLTKTADGADFVKVLGFGTMSPDENSSLNNVKKVEYYSPEQCADAAEIDSRSDVYSLGVILYEMLAGEVPFTGENATEVMLKHAQEPPPPLSAFRVNAPGDIEQIVLRALAKIPENRFQTAAEFADALNRATVFSTRIAADGKAIAPVALTDQPQNNLWKTAFIVLAGIAVLSGFFIYMTQVKQTNPATTMQTDANGSPVQPVNPATGKAEESLSNMSTFTPGFDANTNSMTQPQVMPETGGGSYGNPWERSTNPPPGAPVPQYVPPTGQYYDGNVNPGSQFMTPDGNVYVVVPKNTNTAVNAQTTPKGKTSPTPPAANVQTAPTNTKPAVNPPANTAVPTRPTPKPVEQPKTDKAPAKPNSSGKQQDTE